MTKTTHLIGGVASAAALLNLAAVSPAGSLTPPVMISCATAILVGSLFPDIDIPTSKVGRSVKPASVAINAICGHRGLFHAPLLYILAIAAGCFFAPSWRLLFLAFGAGVMSHLILDLFNRNGIPLLWPVKWRASLGNIAVGGIGEKLFAGVLLVGTVLLSFNLFQ